jgi:hypothetical protein
LLKQKVAQKVTIILGYFILSKNHSEPPKAAQLAKKLPNLVTLTTPDISGLYYKNILIVNEPPISNDNRSINRAWFFSGYSSFH